MTGPAPSAWVDAAFIALTLAVVAALLAATWWADAGQAAALRARRLARTGLLVAAWMAITLALAASGLLARFDRLPPPFLLVALTGFTAATAFALSPAGARLAGLGCAALIAFQVFRLPLELLLHQLHVEGVLPVQMTFAGRNFDILTAVLAVPLAWRARRAPLPRRLIVAWNALGVALLFTIVGIAILSAPTPLRLFTNEPANTIVARVPWVWLPALLVPAAWAGHLLVWRALAAPAAPPSAGRRTIATEGRGTRGVEARRLPPRSP